MVKTQFDIQENCREQELSFFFFLSELVDYTTRFAFLHSMFNLMVSMMSGGVVVSMFKRTGEVYKF